MSRPPLSSRARFETAARSDGEKSEHARPVDGPGQPSRSYSLIELARRYYDLMSGQRQLAFLILLAAPAVAALKLIPAGATGFVVDYVLGSRPLPEWALEAGLPSAPGPLLAVTVVAIIVSALVGAGIGLAAEYWNQLIFMRLQSRLRRRLFRHAIRLPLHRLQRLKSGGATSILRDDAGNAAGLFGNLIYTPWRAAVQLLATVVILVLLDWRMLLVPTVLLPLVAFSQRAWIGRIRPLWRSLHAERQRIDGRTTEIFGGIRLMWSFGRQIPEQSRYTRDQHLMVRHKFRVWWASQAINLTWGLIIPLAGAGLLWLGGTRVLEDSALVAKGALAANQAFTAGDLVMFLVYLAMLLEPLSSLTRNAANAQNGLAGFERVLAVMDEPSGFSARAADKQVHAHDLAEKIGLESVRFSYPGTEQEVIQGIDLEIPVGCTLALVGHSGAGKTTLCNLIARFYDVTDGRITIDGLDVREFDVNSYRRLFGIVEQDVFLFEGSVAENIAYGCPRATEAAIRKAARAAQADDFISALDQGYETIIGERGVRLSGGQRQRIAIARALLADSRIFIFDEPTSELDPESERAIKQSLKTLMHGRTGIIIAHRLSTVVDADQIVLMHEGRILAKGSHGELVHTSPEYRELMGLDHPAPGVSNSHPREAMP